MALALKQDPAPSQPSHHSVIQQPLPQEGIKVFHENGGQPPAHMGAGADAQAQETRSQLWFTSPREAGGRKSTSCPTFLLPLPRPDEEGLQEGPRGLGEKMLTRAWDTARSRFAEVQKAFSAPAPRSQDTLLNTPPNMAPLPWEGVASLSVSNDEAS